MLSSHPEVYAFYLSGMAWRFVIIVTLLLMILLFRVDGNEGRCAGITRGRRFVIAFTGNDVSDLTSAEISLIVVAFSDQPTTVTISSKHVINDDGPYVTTFVLDARRSRRINLPTDLLLRATSEHSDKVVEVDASSDVSVYGLNYAPFTTDAFLAIPVNNLGVSYVAMSYENDGFRDDASLFAVVGVEDETMIRVVLTAGVTIDGNSYLSGETMQLTVHRYEVIQLVSDSNQEYIGGSVIESDKPVALFTGHLCASTPGSYCDTLSEQVVPVESWSNTYIYTATGSVYDRSIYIIHSYYENSEVTIPGIEPVTLQIGEFWQGELQGSGVITSNQPISVLQLLRTINRNIVDPSIIQVPSEEQFSFIFGFSTPPKSGGDSEGFFNFLNIIVKSDESETILLNGEPVLTDTSHSHHSIPGTSYDVYTVEVSKGEGVFFVEQSSYLNTSAFSVIVYGYEDDETYGYSAGLFLPSDERLLNIEPFFLREVGGEQLVVTLPCLENNVVNSQNVFCRFITGSRVIDVPGNLIHNVYTIICTTPRFHEVSYVTVEVSVDGKDTFPFRGTVYVLSQDILPAKVTVLQSNNVAGNIDFTIERNISVQWDPAELFAVEYIDILIEVASKGVGEDQGFIWSTYLKIASSLENLGSFTFLPSAIQKESLDTLKMLGLSSAVITLKANDKHNRPIFHVLSSEFLKLIGSSNCSKWLDVLQSANISDLAPCPCINQHAVVDDNFEPDDNPYLEYFHEGASSCFRSVVGSFGAGQQCCYGSDGNILVGHPGGGTADVYAPGSAWGIGTIFHFWYDVLPWVACCKLESQCEIYYDFRPSDDCSNYEEPGTTIGTGDPHFISLDGKWFTFNGAGEFLLVKSSIYNLTFQARMEALPGTNASVYTAFVLSSEISDTIQIQRSPLNGTLILVNGESIHLSFNGYLIRQHDFRGMRVTLNSEVSEVRVRLHNGLATLIRIKAEMMSFSLQLPDAFKGQTEGLLGNFNDLPDDDFLLPNGSSLSPNSTLETIHFEFGLSWILGTNTSKFTYLPSSDFWSFFDPGFLPNLKFPDVDSVSEEIRSICGDSAVCLYDAVTSNSINFAKDSLRDIKTFETVKEILVKIVSCGHPGKIKNGRINGSIFLVGYKVVASCNEGFYREGYSDLVCHSNGTWSQELPNCHVIKCGFPAVENGFIDGSEYDIGFTINISCNEGFTLMGQFSLTCLPNSSWSTALPTCAYIPVASTDSPSLSGFNHVVIIIAVICILVLIAAIIVGYFIIKKRCNCSRRKHHGLSTNENKAFEQNVHAT